MHPIFHIYLRKIRDVPQHSTEREGQKDEKIIFSYF